MFKDKIVLITGGTRGIGRATALKFAKLGAKVIVVFANNQAKADSLVDEIKSFGGEINLIKADVS